MQNCTWILRFILISVVNWLFLDFRFFWENFSLNWIRHHCRFENLHNHCTYKTTYFEKEQSIAYIYISKIFPTTDF